MSIPGVDAVARFQANEDRFNKFLNDPNNYLDNLGNPVESIIHLANTLAATALNIRDMGAWAVSTVYLKNDIVKYNNINYICITPHTSASTWVANSEKWNVYLISLLSDLLATGANQGANILGYISSLAGALPTTLAERNNREFYARDLHATDETSGADTIASLISKGIINIEPSATFVPGAVRTKPNITYRQGRSHYSKGKANGEQFYSESGETAFFKSMDVPEVIYTGTGTDYTPSGLSFGIKFTTSSDASYIQGVEFRCKKSAGLTDLSTLNFQLYTDSAGSPGTLIGQGGLLFGGQVTTSYLSTFTLLQNFQTPLSTNTTYWIVVTKSVTGGDFYFDCAAGSGKLYDLSPTTDTLKSPFFYIYARSEYPIHASGNFTHGFWASSLTGVGVRGDSNAHYGGYFQSVADAGCRGYSTFRYGVFGGSIHGTGTYGETSSIEGYGVEGYNSAPSNGYPGIYGHSKSGVGIIGYTESTDPHVTDVRCLNGKFTLGGAQWNQGTAAPTTGTWFQGDIIWNSAPSNAAGVPIGWVCVATGTPGIWRPFGLTT
jgi:hypothetical protein